MALVVVGSVALDDIETPSGKVEGVLGGAASHCALAASYFAPVHAVGVVGSDFPPEHLEFLASRGIDVEGIYTSEGRTFRWGGRYSDDLIARDTLFTELGVFEGFAPRLPEPYRSCEFAFLANIHPGLQLQVLEQVRAPRFVAMDTMNYWIEGTPDELAQVVARVDALVINDEESLQLTGERNVVRAAEAIRRLGPDAVVIKRGEYGALLFDGTGAFAAPAYPLYDVLDPTGAGDSFAGGFMGALARDGSLEPDALRRAVISGSVLASFCVERFGVDRFRDLGRTEIDARFAQFRALTRF